MARSWFARSALGVCGTDREIVSGAFGGRRPDSERLVLGHESYGEVIAAPPGGRFAAGDRIVGIVRRPDPVPCPACAAGEWDMCRNGRYTERGIKGLHGFGSERFRIEPSYAIKVDPALGELGVLLEPASIVAKAWDHIERIGRRFHSWEPRRVLVTGAGPVGLLAALMGKQRDYEVYVLDRAKDGPKPQLVRDLGALYLTGTIDDISELAPDVIIECTGAPPADRRRSRPHRAERHRVPARHRRASRDPVRFRAIQPDDGAQQRRGVRLGQRQPPALRDGRRNRSADADQAWLDG